VVIGPGGDAGAVLPATQDLARAKGLLVSLSSIASTSTRGYASSRPSLTGLTAACSGYRHNGADLGGDESTWVGRIIW